MLQLRRVHLESVGHPNARFAPLDLDLTDEEGRPTHTVVWLRNGGGKSSLLNLLFAVVRPHRREFLGGNDDGKDRRLADYVLDGDTGHVCIEWGRPGDRRPTLVTGMALEWRDRSRVADESRLRRLWYAFVPSDHREPGLLAIEPTLTFDSLPRTEDGRRLSLTRFRDRLRALAAIDPSLRLVTPGSQAEWRRELEQHDLDPEVLRYQLQMNREEGGASELFKRRCRSASDFVDLLLELAVADERTERVADVYTRYADELARRPDVERNRDFLAGALERLEPLVELDAAHMAADRDLRAVLADAAGTASALRALAGTIREQAAADKADAADHRRATDDAAAQEQRRRARAQALRALAAGLDVDDARTRHDDTVAALTAAEQHLAATALLEPLAGRGAIDAEIATIDEELHADPSDADRQLRRTRTALVGRLRADMTDSAAAADNEQRLASARQRDAEDAAAEAQRATTESGRLDQALTMLEERSAAWRDRVTDLRGRGVLDDGEGPAAALDRATAALDEARRARADRHRVLAALDGDIRSCYARVSDLEGQLGDARARASTCGHGLAQMYADAAALTGDPRLRELAETDEIDLWRTGSGLVERLEARVADADRALADEAVTAAADRAALVALQTDGLLPARAVVADVVAVLADHDVPAVSGWRHLAEHVPPDQRPQVVAQTPAVVDGVVVTDPALLDRARAAVEDLTEPLRSVVVVSLAPHPSSPADDLIVAPVDPALYDRAHAEQTRARLRPRLAYADRARATLLAARNHDAALADRVRRLLRSYPPSRRTGLDDDARLARHDQQRLIVEREATTSQLTRLERQRADVARDDDGDLSHLSSVVAELTALRAAQVDAGELEALAVRVREARARADEATSRVEQLRRAAAQHQVAAQRHLDERDRLRDELAGLDGVAAGAVGSGDAEAATQPADVLRRRVRLLEAGVDAERSDHALSERRRLLAERRAELDREASAADAAAVQAASALLRSPEARDRRARAVAREHARRRRDTALEARAEAAERLRAARAARDQLATAGPVDLPQEIATAANARRRAAAALAEADRLRDAAAAARDRADAGDRDAARRHQDADRIDHLAELLTIELRARPTTGAPDTAGERLAIPEEPGRARTLVDDLLTRIDEHAGRVDRAGRAAAGAASDVRRFVTDDRFSPLDGPIRERLGSDPVGVARDGATLTDQLRMRLTQCEQKLDELTAHRRLLVREIAADTQRGLWLLRQADQVSALPAGFGEWSDQRFLHIRYAAPAIDDELLARLEAMVDQLVDEGVRPAGVPLLQRAVHAAVGVEGFAVQILKPNPALRPQRVPVTELATFSGGEQLTAAILLYCTLARLRAQARQTQTAGGMLTLDNPIGKSSNVTLLQLQRRVADAMGVQLVYTTAVDDREAVGVLPHWIRLRNERRDTRSGNLHVERVTAGEGEQGTVEATHMWRRADTIAVVPGGR
jgi:multidrug efflux pump subunit AcrA (membrane-fusion protein)